MNQPCAHGQWYMGPCSILHCLSTYNKSYSAYKIVYDFLLDNLCLSIFVLFLLFVNLLFVFVRWTNLANSFFVCAR